MLWNALSRLTTSTIRDSNLRTLSLGDDMPDVEPNKDHLYGRYQRQEDWRNNLHRKVAHKSLDIPETEDVNVDNSRHGIGMKELIAIGAMVIGGPLAYAAFTQFMKPEPEQKPPVSVGPVDSEYEVIFYDKDGNKISVPHISKREK